MANLLDQIFSGDSGQALGLLGASMMAGNAPQGFSNAVNLLAQAPDRNLERQLRKAQIDNFNSEVAQRAAATQRLSEGLGMLKGVLGGSGTPSYQPGQLGSGTMDVVPNANPTAPVQRSAGGLANATPNDIALLKAYTGVDLTEPWKIAKQGFEQKPGTYQLDATTNRRTYLMNPADGRTVDESGRIGMAPGATDAIAATTFASELPKAIATAASTVNLRNGDNGKAYPVVSINENPVLQGIMDRYFGGSKLGAPTAAAPPASPVAAPVSTPDLNPQSADGHPVIAPADQKAADAESLRMIQAELNNPNLPPDQKPGLQREIARLTVSQSQSGFPTPTMVVSPQGGAPGQGYGMTNEQQNATAANKAYAEGAAKDMVETRKNILSAGQSAPVNIAKYQQLGRLLQDVDGGKLTQTGTNIASTMNSLGIKIDKNLPNKEAAASLGNEMALQLRSPAGGAGMPGALSDKDREFLTGMVPNANQTSQGRKMLIDSYIALQKRNQQVAQFATNYEKKYGRLDSGFFDQLQSWSGANPLFGGK
jgi:hypothetical protein